MKPEENQKEEKGEIQSWDKLEEYLGSAASTLSKLFSMQPPITIPKTTNFKKDFAKELHPSIKRLQNAMTLLLEFLITPDAQDLHLLSMEFTEQICQLAAIASVFSDHPEQYLSIVTTGKTLQEVFGIDDDAMELLYRAAKYIYEQQHYGEAAAAFAVLTLMCPNNHTFWIGLANSEYFLRNYEYALVAYAMAAQANPRDPLCHLFSAHCYEAMSQKDLAVNALELALISIGEQQQYANWRKKITEHKQRLSQK